MKIDSINLTTFNSKQKFATNEQLDLIKKISAKMQKQSSNGSTENQFISSFVSSAKKGKYIFYRDAFSQEGKSSVKIGSKSVLIDNTTGEIIKIEKPWYTSINRVLNTMTKCLRSINSNYDDDNLVTKGRFNIHEFTRDGFAKILSGELLIDGDINV